MPRTERVIEDNGANVVVRLEGKQKCSFLMGLPHLGQLNPSKLDPGHLSQETFPDCSGSLSSLFSETQLSELGSKPRSGGSMAC